MTIPIRNITLPKTGSPNKYSRGGKQSSNGFGTSMTASGIRNIPKTAPIGYQEPSVKRVGMTRTKKETDESFLQRQLAKVYKLTTCEGAAEATEDVYGDGTYIRTGDYFTINRHEGWTV